MFYAFEIDELTIGVVEDESSYFKRFFFVCFECMIVGPQDTNSAMCSPSNSSKGRPRGRVGKVAVFQCS